MAREACASEAIARESDTGRRRGQGGCHTCSCLILQINGIESGRCLKRYKSVLGSETGVQKLYLFRSTCGRSGPGGGCGVSYPYPVQGEIVVSPVERECYSLSKYNNGSWGEFFKSYAV